MTPFSMTLSDL